MDTDVTPEPEKPKPSLESFLTPLKKLFATLVTPFKSLPSALTKLVATLATPLKNLPTALKNLPIPKKLVIPIIAGAVLLVAGGTAFGLLHGKIKHGPTAQTKVLASASGASATKASSACSGVVRDIYRQTVDEDPSVTLAEVRSEVASSGVSCVPVPEIATELKDLSPACRDMVQYTYLGVHDSHLDIKVSDIREKVVQKSVACEHDRRPEVASVPRHKLK